MARLIDADELKLELKWLEDDTPVYHDVMSTIDDAPTVDPVKRGHWELSPFDGNWTCSKCGNKPYHSNMKNMNYCPNCGAKMDKRREDGTIVPMEKGER